MVPPRVCRDRWNHTHSSHTRAPTTPRLTIPSFNTTSITSLTQTFNTRRLKKTIFNNGRYTANIPTDPHTVTTTDIKTNMRHIHRSIVSRHLGTRGNTKILHTPLSPISNSIGGSACEQQRDNTTNRLLLFNFIMCTVVVVVCHN